MCPPASDPSEVELGEYPTDEVICKLLMRLQSGHTLPGNVLSDVDPYQTVPSNLPPEMWYFSPGPKMDTKNGVWRSTGEACVIHSTSLIVGLRRTLQFYEGPTHDGQKTNWTMQEYTTTEVYTGKPDAGALCRVFLVDDSSSGGHLSKSELVKNTDVVAGAGPSDVANQSSNQRLDDCILEGAFLEMDDLDAPLSRTTSSADSSCMTMSMTSEEFFDIDALSRELGDDDTVDQEIRDPRIKLNLCAPAKLKQVVMQPTTLGSLDNAKESELPTGQTSKTTPTPEDKSTSNEVDTSAPPPPPPVLPPPPPLSSSPPPPPPPPVLPPSSSNSSEGSSKEEKKDHANRTKKRKKFLCCFAF